MFLRDTGEGAIEVSFYAGDALTQARELYNRPDVIARIRALAQRPDWDVRPNFHFGARVDGRCHTRGPIRLDDYLNLWRKRIEGEYSRPREEWDQYWNKMVELGVTNPDDRSEFDKWFRNTRQRHATPRPGVIGSRRSRIEQAEELDAHGRFADDVTEAIRVVLRTCEAAIERPDRSVGGHQRTIEGPGEAAEAERDRRIVAEVAATRQAAGKLWTAEMEARMLAERAERRRSAG